MTVLGLTDQLSFHSLRSSKETHQHWQLGVDLQESDSEKHKQETEWDKNQRCEHSLPLIDNYGNIKNGCLGIFYHICLVLHVTDTTVSVTTMTKMSFLGTLIVFSWQTIKSSCTQGPTQILHPVKYFLSYDTARAEWFLFLMRPVINCEACYMHLWPQIFCQTFHHWLGPRSSHVHWKIDAHSTTCNTNSALLDTVNADRYPWQLACFYRKHVNTEANSTLLSISECGITVAQVAKSQQTNWVMTAIQKYTYILQTLVNISHH